MSRPQSLVCLLVGDDTGPLSHKDVYYVLDYGKLKGANAVSVPAGGLIHDQRVQLLFQEVVPTFIFTFILLELLALGPGPFGCSCGFLCVVHCVRVLIDTPSCRTLPPLHPATGAMLLQLISPFCKGFFF